MPIRPSRRPLALLAAAAVAALGLVGAAVAQPPAAQAAGAWSTQTIAGMTVHVYVPDAAPIVEGGRALMVSLHGCVQTANAIRDGGQWVGAAEETGMVVAVPSAPNGGVLLGCWDYYDGNHSRTAPVRHDDNLLDLVTALRGRADLGIDARQVYLSGLSSGGGQTMVMGCLAPDVFAGIGINAGPTVGTTSGQIGSVAVTESQGRATCERFAGSAAGSFSTQLTSVVYGSNDTTVAPGYNTLNGRIMAGLYGATAQTSTSLAGLPGSSTNGTETRWSDAQGPRVSVIQNTGLGHNWPAGGGPGGAYISTTSIDYPRTVTRFFFEHNRRVDGVAPTPTPTPDPTPTPTPTPDPQGCVTATNAAHQSAGRAVSYGTNPYNPYYAIGTQDYLGQGDATVTSLQQLSATSWDHVPSC